MIGVFSYTVILTYLSLASAVTAFVFGFNGNPRMAVICLIICGLCDLFDGRIARLKKKRTDFEKDFGVQIDSLTDIVAFGVVPVAIGVGLAMSDTMYIPVYIIYVLSGLIRLGYYNSLANTEKKSDGFVGLPITTSALIIPIVYLFRRIAGFAYLYPFVLLLISLLYLLKIKIPRPKGTAMYVLFGTCILELILVLVLR